MYEGAGDIWVTPFLWKHEAQFLHFVFLFVGFYSHGKGLTNGLYLVSDND